MLGADEAGARVGAGETSGGAEPVVELCARAGPMAKTDTDNVNANATAPRILTSEQGMSPCLRGILENGAKGVRESMKAAGFAITAFVNINFDTVCPPFSLGNGR
jgi:hypothetical protein